MTVSTNTGNIRILTIAILMLSWSGGKIEAQIEVEIPKAALDSSLLHPPGNPDIYDFLSETNKYEAEIAELLNYAYSFKGTPYRFGANGPRAFDCSAFTRHIFKKYDLILPRTAQIQYTIGDEISVSDIKPGDLVFFRPRKHNSKRIGHVGIVTRTLKGKGFAFIHAARKRGVSESYSWQPYYSKRFAGARRII